MRGTLGLAHLGSTLARTAKRSFVVSASVWPCSSRVCGLPTVKAALFALVFGFGVCLATLLYLGLEAMICALMATPLVVGLAYVGALSGRVIKRKQSRDHGGKGSALAVLSGCCWSAVQQCWKRATSVATSTVAGGAWKKLNPSRFRHCYSRWTTELAAGRDQGGVLDPGDHGFIFNVPWAIGSSSSMVARNFIKGRDDRQDFARERVLGSGSIATPYGVATTMCTHAGKRPARARPAQFVSGQDPPIARRIGRPRGCARQTGGYLANDRIRGRRPFPLRPPSAR